MLLFASGVGCVVMFPPLSPADMKDYIARFGHGSAKLARQAQSKEKTLAKMERGGLTEKVRSRAHMA